MVLASGFVTTLHGKKISIGLVVARGTGKLTSVISPPLKTHLIITLLPNEDSPRLNVGCSLELIQSTHDGLKQTLTYSLEDCMRILRIPDM